MAFKYCYSCKGELEEATAREDLDELFSGQDCPNCGATQRQEKSMAEWIVNIDERLRALEDKS